jgi:hypothetical protein
MSTINKERSTMKIKITRPTPPQTVESKAYFILGYSLSVKGYFNTPDAACVVRMPRGARDFKNRAAALEFCRCELDERRLRAEEAKS